MMNDIGAQDCYAELATLLSHPQDDYDATVDSLIGVFNTQKAGKLLREFRAAMAGLSATERQELYARTFDLNPLCSPALSVHLFGIESFKRSHLMVGLLDMYRTAAFPCDGEAADHMSTLVRFLPWAAPDERDELMHYVLLPGLEKIAAFLATKANPFSLLIVAAQAVITATAGKEARCA